MPRSSLTARLPFVAIAGAATVIAWGLHIALRGSYLPGDPVRLTVTSLLTLCFAAYIVSVVRVLTSLDEFQRQVQLTALTIAFPASLVLVFALGFFAVEGALLGADPRDLAFAMLVIYLVAWLAAWLRYR